MDREPPEPALTVPSFDAVVLAGGRASRLGTPKPQLVVDGSPLLDRVLRATGGAERVVLVGPAELARPGVEVVREDPLFGGPVAGIAAGLDALARRDAPVRVLVLACDVPRAEEAVPHLLSWATRAGTSAGTGTADGPDGAVLVRDGRDQWLVGLYLAAALRAAIEACRDPELGVHGLPVRRVVGDLRLHRIDDPDGTTVDIDTPADLARWVGSDP